MTARRDTETFIAGDDRVRRLREKPGLTDEITLSRAQMRQASTASARLSDLILLRHGATALTGSRYSGRGSAADPGGPELSETGEAQAATVAGLLAAESINAVVCSPLRRARSTADVVGARLGLAPAVDADLAEVDFGVFEGLTYGEAQARWPDEIERWYGDPAVPPPGGESVLQLRERVLRARDRLPAGRVLVVSHATPIQLLLADVLGLAPAGALRLRVGPGSVSRMDGHGVAYVNRLP
jgi:broad specificity phosphatase PhoE